MDILDLLYQRMWQLQGRIIQIRNYVKIDAEVISKKDFTLSDIPKMEYKINECLSAIHAIEKFRKESRKLHKEKEAQVSDTTKMSEE